MSLLTINGAPVTKGDIFLPRYGSWWADVETDNDALYEGRVTLTCGDLEIVGTVVPGAGGVSDGTGRWHVRGGLAWDTVVEARPYQTDASSGVPLRTVLTDAARDCGAWDAGVDLPPAARVGSSYSRIAGPARDTLDQLRARGCPPWYMTPAGRTVFAVRPSPTITATARVRRRNLAHGLRWVSVDEYAPWSPGAVFEGATLGYVLIQATERDTVLELKDAT